MKQGTRRLWARGNRRTVCLVGLLLLLVHGCSGHEHTTGGSVAVTETQGAVTGSGGDDDGARAPVCPAYEALHALPAAATSPVGNHAGSFRVDDNGAATYTVPIAVPPGRAGMQPALALSYHSDRGNGPLGVGFALTGLSAIGRCPSNYADDGELRDVRYDRNDRFCLDGQRLVAVQGEYGAEGTQYRTVPDSFVKVVSHASDPALGPDGFVVWTKDGRVLTYGFSADADGRSALLGPPSVRFAAWALRTVSDGSGNYFQIHYEQDQWIYPGTDHFYTREQWPVSIDYTGHDPALGRGSWTLTAGSSPPRQVRFAYDRRPDSLVAYRQGMRLEQTRRLISMETFAPGSNSAAPIHRYTFTHGTSATHRSQLLSMQQCTGSRMRLPATYFQWNDSRVPNLSRDVTAIAKPTNPALPFAVVDLDGDGRDELVVPHDVKRREQRITGRAAPRGGQR